MNLKSYYFYWKAKKIIAKNGDATKVVILGSHAGEGILGLPEANRHCEIIAIVDDFRIKEAETYFNIPLITSTMFTTLAAQHDDLIAINTCENKKPKEYFNRLCWKNNVACMNNWQATAVFRLYEHVDPDERHAHVWGGWRYKVRSAGDWLIANTCLWQRRSNDIALIRMDGAGDFFIWLNSAKHIREHYADKKITLFCNSAWAEYAKTLPYWDIVVPIEYKKFLRQLIYRWKIMLKLRFGHYATIIQPTYFRYLIRDDVLIRSSGSPERIGWHGGSISHLRVTGIPSAQFERSNPWYTQLLQSSIPIRPEIERDAEFVSILTGKHLAPAIASLPLKAEKVPPIDGPYCILFPGASWHGRRWPTHKFAMLANKLAEQFNWHIVLSGSKSEKFLCDEIEAALSGKVINLAGKTNWVELVELIRGAKILISNETSAVHIAPAVDTTSICILGGGHYGMFVPYPSELAGKKPIPAIKEMSCYGCGWSCTLPREARGPVPCIRDIAVEDVLDLVHKALDDSSDSPAHPPANVADVFGIPM
ncbi:hypothetical protein LG202_21850 [Methylobacillus methanolivorans]